MNRYDELTNRFSKLLDDMAYNGIDHEKEMKEIKEEIKKLDDDMFNLF